MKPVPTYHTFWILLVLLAVAGAAQPALATEAQSPPRTEPLVEALPAGATGEAAVDQDQPVAAKMVTGHAGSYALATEAGDINLNGIPNEVSDAIQFTRYFIYGLQAFHIDQEAQILATDVNGDGLTLSVGDLVAMIKLL